MTCDGLWFSPSTPVSPTNKTDRHDITEVFLKVALNTINQTKLKLLWKYWEFRIQECILKYIAMETVYKWK